MKTKILSIVLSFLTVGLSAQNVYEPISSTTKNIASKHHLSHKVTPGSGNQGTGVSNSYYAQNVCGLNYVYGSVMTETRSIADGFNTNGTGFPATISISGLPASCFVILQAYLYYDASYTESTAPSTTVTLKNPAGATATYASTTIGTGPEKCWGETGTASYRTDVTAAISGNPINGNYTIQSINGFANAASEVDGCTLFIIYQAGPTSTTGPAGTLFLFDGAVVENTYSDETTGLYDDANDSIYGFDVCNASNIASAWFLVADQTNNPSAYTTNIETVNAGHTALASTKTFPNNQWNFNLFPTSVTNGQTTTSYYTYRNDDPTFSNSDPFDCFNWVMFGMYWQNTGCVDCFPDIETPTTGSGSLTNVACNGQSNGSITAHVTGGTSPYTYTWSPSSLGTDSIASGLSAGTYTILVEDAICNTAQITVAVGQPAILGATMGIPNYPACYGEAGSVTVTPSGGTAPYTYAWSPNGGTGATGTGFSAGTYTVTVTDKNGCTNSTQTVVITQPSEVTANVTPTYPKCNGSDGSATVTATGGAGTFTYTWSPSGGSNATATGLSTGTYSVTVKDANGCSPTNSLIVIITQPPPVVAGAGPQTNVLCNGDNTGSATVGASGGAGGFTYTWSPTGGSNATATGLSAGTYSVAIKDANGCSPTNSPIVVVITQPIQSLTAAIGTTSNPTCDLSNGTAVLNSPAGGVPPYTYLWTPTGETTATATGLSAGTYTVKVTDNNGCVFTTSALILNETFTVSACCPTIITKGSSTTVTVSGSGDVANTWEPSSYTCINPPLCSEITATPTVTTTYTATATSTYSCTTVDTVTIFVELPCFDPVIPNVFTPGNAGQLGVDNVFYINTTNLTTITVHIYDRWGKEIFSSSNLNQAQYGWNGNTEGGSAATAGVYYYIIQATCESNTYKKDGFVQLIR